MSKPTVSAALSIFEPGAPQTCSIEVVAHVTGVPRHRIGVYCRAGLLAASGDPAHDGWRFDPSAVRRLREVEAMRQRFGDNLPAIKTILHLAGELEALRREVQQLRTAGGGRRTVD